MIKVVNGYPPNFNEIDERFHVKGKDVVFTYGNTLYNPKNGFIDDALFVHEETHSQQQTDPKDWWDRYLKDDEFRLSQEVEAYQNQYRYFKKTEKSRERVVMFLHKIARDLASDVYGGVVSYQEAVNLIEA